MLPTYPQFTRLKLADQKELEDFIQSHPPHSDYNLASLWSYDTDNSIRITKLNGNLVAVFADYITQQPLISFLGINNPKQTIATLIDDQQKLGTPASVSLLSQETINALPKGHPYIISEDRDNFDYIIKTDDLVAMKGTKYLKKRTKIHAFERKHGTDARTQTLDLSDRKIYEAILALFLRWETQRNKPRQETQRELDAIKKLLGSVKKFSLHGIGILVENELIAFAIDEVIHDNHGVTHFEKADMHYRGVYEYLKRQSASHLQRLGCQYINFEQDLGKEGLRSAKLAYRPIRFVKKFTVTLPRL